MSGLRDFQRALRRFGAYVRESYLAWTVSVLNGPPLRSLDADELAAREFALKVEALGLDVEEACSAALMLAAAGATSDEVGIFARIVSTRGLSSEDVRMLRDRGYRIDVVQLYRALMDERLRQRFPKVEDRGWPFSAGGISLANKQSQRPELVTTIDDYKLMPGAKKPRSIAVQRLIRTFKDGWCHIWDVLEEWWLTLGTICAVVALYLVLIVAITTT